MKIYLQILLILVVIFIVSCKEPYNPEIDESEQMLVVDGLLSDESNVIKVNLTNAAPFRDHAYLPEIGANVVVSDDLGNNYILAEKTPGNYESKPFNFQYGRKYTLVIRTQKNKYYRSTPQTLFPKIDLDTVAAVITAKTLQTTKDGQLILKTLPGLEFSTIINDDEDSPYYRFSNTVLVEYKEKQDYVEMPYDTLPYLFNCWRKYFPNQFFNLSEPLNNLDKHKQTLSFCPLDSVYFDVIQEYYVRYPESDIQYWRSLYYFGITIRQDHLNADVFQYYKSINQQLESNNRIFDPVSFQVRGNISCENDPEEAVLGVFEVSSTSLRTYKYSEFLQDRSVKYEEIEPFDIDKLPLSGKMYDQFPSFWIYNY